MASKRTEEILKKLISAEEKLRLEHIELVKIKCELETVSINVKGNDLDHSKYKEITKVLKKIQKTNDGIQTCVHGMDRETYKTLNNLEKQRDSGIDDNSARSSVPDITIGEPVQEEGVDNDAETIDVQSADSETAPCVAVESEEDVNVEDPHRLLACRRVRTSADSGIALSTASSINRLSQLQRDSTTVDEDEDQIDPECEGQDGATAGETNDLNKQTGTGKDNSIDDNTSIPTTGDPSRSSAVFYGQLGPDEQDFFRTQGQQLDHHRGQKSRRPSQGDITLPSDRPPTNDK